MGTPFVAVEPTVTNAFLSVPMGGLARGLEASPTFGPSIRAGLEAAAGLIPGTAEYELFFIVFQTVFDSADPINWSAEAALYNNIVLHEVIGDTVLPNYVPTAPFWIWSAALFHLPIMVLSQPRWVRLRQPLRCRNRWPLLLPRAEPPL